VVVGWDPNEPVSVTRAEHAAAANAAKGAPKERSSVVKLLVLVGNRSPRCGGELAEADLAQINKQQNANVVMTPVYNLSTAAREYAAVTSSDTLQPYLQAALLGSSNDSGGSAGELDTTNDSSNSSKDSSGRAVSSNSNNDSSISGAILRELRPPGTVPALLWARTKLEFNDSQLVALRAVAVGSDSGITLIGGSPGTGSHQLPTDCTSKSLLRTSCV
jgi:hypothetical protein